MPFSVGETLAVSKLIKLIQENNSNATIVISSITETGHAEAKKTLQMADYHVYLPFDLGYIIRPILKRAMPDVVILAETDVWYNFLYIAKKLGAKCFTVNAKISERSFKRFNVFPFVAHRFFSLIDHFCLQDAVYQKRFYCLGIKCPGK